MATRDDLRAYLLRKLEEQPDTDGLDEAMAADQGADKLRALGMAGERASAMLQRRAPNFAGLEQNKAALNEWLTKRAATKEAEAGRMGAARGLGDIDATETKERIEAAAAASEADRFERRQAEQERHNRAIEESMKYAAVVDPIGGRIVKYNTKGPGHEFLTESAPGMMRKPTEKQQNEAIAASENLLKLDEAIGALEQNPGAYGGVANFAASLGETIGGTPAQSILSKRYSPGELQAKNYVTNIVSAIINERAGANVTLREELRQKFLPQDTDSPDQAKQKLADLRRFEELRLEARHGKQPGASEQAPTRKTIGDKQYEKRADGWYEVD